MEKKGRASFEPLPTLEGTGEDKVITWTRGLLAGWRDLPIKNIIAFDFYKYQG